MPSVTVVRTWQTPLIWYSKMDKTNLRDYLEVSCNAVCWEHHNQTHHCCLKQSVSLSTSPNILPSHVSPIADSFIKESSQSCHLWVVSAEYCWHPFWNRRRGVKSQLHFIFFLSWKILLCLVKRKLQIRSEGRVQSTSAKQTSYCAQLIFCWGEWSGCTVFIWGEVTVILLC